MEALTFDHITRLALNQLKYFFVEGCHVWTMYIQNDPSNLCLELQEGQSFPDLLRLVVVLLLDLCLPLGEVPHPSHQLG